MGYYYINTDAKYLGPDKYKLWLKHNLAFTGGDKCYGEYFAKLKVHDVCFMYVAGKGVRAAGEVIEPWDGKSYDSPIVYKPRVNEYRLRVDWFIALRDQPISACDLRRMGLHPPIPTVQSICNHKAAKKLLRTMQQMHLPEEVNTPYRYPEGATSRIEINTYERNRQAREACIKHYGTCCYVCGFSFGAIYGEVVEEYIHVHHLVPLSEIGEEYEVDPVKDLRPVCPNCHAVIHLGRPPYKPEEVRDLIKNHKKNS